MKIFKSKSDLQSYVGKKRNKGYSIGFVPTMGALHEGHLSLVKSANEAAEVTVVSIFVNPTQFDNQGDLENYPKTFDKDVELLKASNCDILFYPTIDEIYHEEVVAQEFDFEGLEFQMEGKFRNGHFNGVGTIVKALFEIVQPDIALFGEKDFQQLQIIKKLVEKYDLPVQVVGKPIFRENDGLAMSSRNARLTKAHREAAPFIFETLQEVIKKTNSNNINQISQWVEKQFNKHPLLELEYFTIAEEETLMSAQKFIPGKYYRAFIAVFAENIRLIDNISLKIIHN